MLFWVKFDADINRYLDDESLVRPVRGACTLHTRGVRFHAINFCDCQSFTIVRQSQFFADFTLLLLHRCAIPRNFEFWCWAKFPNCTPISGSCATLLCSTNQQLWAGTCETSRKNMNSPHCDNQTVDNQLLQDIRIGCERGFWGSATLNECSPLSWPLTVDLPPPPDDR